MNVADNFTAALFVDSERNLIDNEKINIQELESRDDPDPDPDPDHPDQLISCSSVDVYPADLTLDIASSGCSASTEYCNCSTFPMSLSVEDSNDSVLTANKDDVKWEPGEEIVLMELPIDEDFISETALNSDFDLNFAFNGEWRKDVNLSPPNIENSTVLPGDEHLFDYFNALQCMLYKANMPATKDRTLLARRNSPNDGVVVAVLSSPVNCMSILLEGGKQCPGDMLLILSVSWLSKRPSIHVEGLYSLFVHKAVVFSSGRRSYLDVFDPPRRVTYFVNFFTRASTNGTRSDGEAVEVDLDCPMSSSLRLVQLVDNKLWTRIKIAECGIWYPETLAFVYRSFVSYEAKLHSVTIVHLLTKEGIESLVHDEIERFINLPEMEFTDKVVVKPSGLMWRASRGVSFHSRFDIDSITRAVIGLAEEIEDGNVILVEAFYQTIQPTEDVEPGSVTAHKMAMRLRSTVCRSPDNVPIMTKLVVGVGDMDKPISTSNSVPQSLNTALEVFGVHDEQEQRRLYQLIREGSENILKVILDYENSMVAEDRGGIGAQTDIIGIDFLLTGARCMTIPVAIEVNSHDCTVNCQMYEFMNPSSRGEAVHPLIQTMIARSQRCIMKGKKILVIGSGGYNKRFIWDAAREYGVDVYLVDVEQKEFALGAKVFIQYDFCDHSKDEQHANKICALLKERQLKVDGCVTFWDRCSPLVAKICDLLHLIGSGVVGSKVAVSKSRMMHRLSNRSSEVLCWPRTSLYATKSFRISSKKDIADTAVELNYPAIMKLDSGCDGFPSVKLVSDAPSAYNAYDGIQEELTRRSESQKRPAPFDGRIIMMEFLTGTEHDVDVIIYQRQLVGAFVVDIGPPLLPLFRRVAAALPSFLPPDKIAQLKTAAYQCCVDIGLCNGVFNVKMKMCPSGPKLLEINQRLGDFYVRDWINAAWGIDLVLYLFMISCGIKPILPNLKLRGHLVGVNVTTSAYQCLLDDPEHSNLLDLLDIQGAVRINRIKEDASAELETDKNETFCNIAVMDSDAENAQNRLIEYMALIGISDFEIPQFLKNFRYSGSTIDRM